MCLDSELRDLSEQLQKDYPDLRAILLAVVLRIDALSRGVDDLQVARQNLWGKNGLYDRKLQRLASKGRVLAEILNDQKLEARGRANLLDEQRVVLGWLARALLLALKPPNDLSRLDQDAKRRFQNELRKIVDYYDGGENEQGDFRQL